MATNAVTRQSSSIARPLKVLIPLIQGELQMGNDAGREHYMRAGQMLLEAKEQVSRGQWTAWLTKNFDMNQRTAQQYMRLARREDEIRSGASHLKSYSSIRDMTGQS